MSIFSKFRKRTSADAIALLAQAHAIHQAEIEFAREEAREEGRRALREQAGRVKDALFPTNVRTTPGSEADQAVDAIRSVVGGVLAETHDDRVKWDAFVVEQRLRRFNEHIEQRWQRNNWRTERDLQQRTEELGINRTYPWLQ